MHYVVFECIDSLTCKPRKLALAQVFPSEALLAQCSNNNNIAHVT